MKQRVELYTSLRRLILPHWRRYLSLVFSITLGLSALLSVQGLLESAQFSIRAKARDLLGADMVLSSWRAFNDQWSAQVRREFSDHGRIAEATELATMSVLGVGDFQTDPKLTSLKAVSQDYPLRGQLVVRSLDPSTGELGAPRVMRAEELSPQQVWVAKSLWHEELRSRLKGQNTGGDHNLDDRHHRPWLSVGGSQFEVAGVLEKEPDAGFVGAQSFAPRVILRKERLSDLGLLKFGSRARHKIYYADKELSLNASRVDDSSSRAQELEKWAERLRGETPDHVELQTFVSGQQNISLLLERVGLFFTMVALVSLILCLIALSIGVWGVIYDQLSIIATARSLGVTARTISSAYRILILGASLLGATLATGLAKFTIDQITPILSQNFELAIQGTLSFSNLALGLAIAVFMGFLVNWVVQRALRRLDAQSVWSGRLSGFSSQPSELLFASVFCLIGTSFLITRQSGSLALGIGFSLSVAGIILLVSIAITTIFSLLRSLLHFTAGLRWPRALRFSVKQLLSDSQRARVALLGIGISLSLISALEVVSESLIAAMSVDDEEAPQFFLIDIQEDQVPTLERLFTELDLPVPQLKPLIRARIAAIGEERVSLKSLSGDSPAARLKRRSLTREFNLTTQVKLSETETLTKGTWWTTEEAFSKKVREVSVESRFAKRMGLNLGDHITFDLQGREMQFEITSIRNVNWLSFAPNFIFSLSPGPLQGAPLTYICASRLPAHRSISELSRTLYRVTPNISVIDLRPALNEGRTLLRSLTTVLSLTPLICALAGLLLLIQVIWRDRKRRESTVLLLYDLGISRRQGWRWVSLELLLLGLLASFLVGLGCLTIAVVACHVLGITMLWSKSIFLWMMLAALLPGTVASLPAVYHRLMSSFAKV